MTKFMNRIQNFRSYLFIQLVMILSIIKVAHRKLHVQCEFSKRVSGSTFNSDIDELVEQRRKINQVFVQKFDSNSPHVSHLRHNEEKYKEVLKCFLSKVTTGQTSTDTHVQN